MRRVETLAAQSLSLQAYLQEIAKFPPLAAEQEHELARRIRQRDDAALQALAESHLQFVAAYAKRYRRLGVRPLDLIHEGNLGLLEAARHFNPDRRRPFITHAAWWVRERMLRRLAERQSGPIAGLLARGAVVADAADDSLAPDDAPGPGPGPGPESFADITALLGVVVAASIRRDRPAPPVRHHRMVWLAARASTSGAALGQLIERALHVLDPTERRLMRDRYGLDEREPWTRSSAAPRPGGLLARRLAAHARRKLRREQHLRGCLN